MIKILKSIKLKNVDFVKVLLLLSFLQIISNLNAQTYDVNFNGIYGLSMDASTYQAKYIKLKNRMIGGSLFYETFAFGKNTPFRIELNHLERSGDTTVNSANIKSYTDIRIMYGKIINKNKRIQFPVFVGPGYNTTRGAWRFSGWSLGLKAGLRFYLKDNIALFGDCGANIMLAPKVGIVYSNGTEETKNIWATKYGFNIGVLYNKF